MKDRMKSVTTFTMAMLQHFFLHGLFRCTLQMSVQLFIQKGGLCNEICVCLRAFPACYCSAAALQAPRIVSRGVWIKLLAQHTLRALHTAPLVNHFLEISFSPIESLLPVKMDSDNN